MQPDLHHEVPSAPRDTSTPEEHAGGSSPSSLTALALGALGIVYGDIGTSPLYAMRESLMHVGSSRAHVLGIVSLVFWSLTLVIVLKYLSFILRADNHGEGGVLSLLALARSQGQSLSAQRGVLLWCGLSGAALLVADGMITPAISVLSAVEGLEVAAPGVGPLVVPIAIAILVGLFVIQKHGTGRIGSLFGPAVMLWFASIAAVGAPWIAKEPAVLAALDPRYGIALIGEGYHGFTVLGSVVLCVTGGEALYADLGHFGRKPILWAWYLVVFPALLISYLGQGAYVLSHPSPVVGNIFYEMVPTALLYPMVAIATLATTIAAQALITGVYSLAQQAIQLGYLPRMTIVHTSVDMEGRIYAPLVNTLLMFSCVGLVLGFERSSALASAYGIAVTGTMGVTSVLFYAAMRKRWGDLATLLPVALFLVVDVAFFGANLVKLMHGGWFPLLIGMGVLALMTSWYSGADAVRRNLSTLSMPVAEFVAGLSARAINRVPGTSVFLARDDSAAPPTLVHYLNHSRALHETIFLLTIETERAPRVDPTKRLEVTMLGEGFIRVVARYGFMESPNVQRVLVECEERKLPIVAKTATVFVGHSSVLPTGTSRMRPWRKHLFSFMNRNAQPAALYYGLSAAQVVELGVRLEI